MTHDDTTLTPSSGAPTGATPEEWERILAAITPTGAATGAAEPTDGTGAAPATPTATQRIRHGGYEAHLYDMARSETPRLERAITESAEAWAHTEELSRDVFHALYQPTPETQAVADDYAANARAIDAMRDTSDYQALHETTAYDELGAAIGAVSLTRRLAAELAKQRQQEEEQAAQEPQAEPEEAAAPQTPEEQAAAQAAAAKAAKKAERKARARAAAQATQLRIAARAAMDEAREAVAQYQAGMAAFGGDAGGEPGGAGWGSGAGVAHATGNIAERAKLAARIAQDTRLQRIAALAGRFRPLAATARRRRAEHIPEEVVGITRGDDLPRVLPVELSLLADPTLSALFYARYVEHGLTQYELQGAEPQGRGPIVLCVDESGSMGGVASEWAAAIGLFLRQIALREKRDFAWIHFSSRGQKATEHYPKGRGTAAQVLASASHFYGGGTDFDTPLREALAQLTTSAYRRGDVIFVTDGICGVSPATLQLWNAARKEKGFACFGALIGHGYGAEALRPFCDEVANVLQPGRDDTAAVTRALAI